MQWAPGGLGQENEIELKWHGETGTGQYEHTMIVRTATCPPQMDRSVFMRAVCHYLLSKLPDDGLPDVCRSIADAFEYYAQTPKALSGYNLQKLQPIKAKPGRTYERPPFPIAEE